MNEPQNPGRHEPVSLLCDDIVRELAGWAVNPRRTEEQARAWPDGLTLAHLGANHPAALVLQGAYGAGAGSLCSFSCEDAPRLAATTSEHQWPEDADIVRIGSFFHLGLYRTLALLLKSQWERHAAKVAGFPHLVEDLEQALGDTRVRARAERAFRPETAPLFFLMREAGLAPALDHVAFDALAGLIVAQELHLLPNDAPEIEEFAAAAELTRRALDAAPAGALEGFSTLQIEWLALRHELGIQLGYEEDQRLENTNLEIDYLRIFGAEHGRIVRAEVRREELLLMMEVLRQNPGLTLAEVEKAVESKKAAWRSRLDEMRRNLAFAAHPPPPPIDLPVRIDAGLLTAYQREFRRVLVELYRITHPDTRERYLDTERCFLPEQVEELDRIYRLAVEIGRSEVGYQHRSLIVLLQALDRAQGICELAGLRVDPGSVIRGKTIEEQSRWLKDEILRLRREIEASQIRLQLLLDDPDIRAKKEMILSPDEHELLRRRLAVEAKRLEAEVRRLEKEWNARIGRMEEPRHGSGPPARDADRIPTAAKEGAAGAEFASQTPLPVVGRGRGKAPPPDKERN